MDLACLDGATEQIDITDIAKIRGNATGEGGINVAIGYGERLRNEWRLRQKIVKPDSIDMESAVICFP